MAKNSMFLSGWEYNRVLNPDPFAPMVSGLPTQALWDGCAQFWMFEDVYCTTESLSGDLDASKALKWQSGYLFDDLRHRGFLKPINLKEYVSDKPALTKQILQVHEQLRTLYDEESILQLLRNGSYHQLESIKLDLLAPILSRLDCVNNISPNSIRNWFDSSDNESQDSCSSALQMIVKPLLAEKAPLRAGISLCRKPGVGLHDHFMDAQKRVEREVEFPMIPHLISGKLPPEEYYLKLSERENVYKPVSDQLGKDYRANIGNLERLRDLAKKHLWPELHHDWIPRLDEDSKFITKFRTLLRDALLSAKFDPYLENFTSLAINAVSVFAGTATFAVTGSPTGAVLTATSVKSPLENLHKGRRKETENLTVFYQKALAKQ
ncbi:hypothetical protein ACFL43_01700 [Thermodesulfobacteriota bacterium]